MLKASKKAALEVDVTAADQWHSIHEQFRDRFGPLVYDRWLRTLAVDRIESGIAFLSTSSEFYSHRISQEFGDDLLQMFKEIDGDIVRLDISVVQTSHRQNGNGAEETAEAKCAQDQAGQYETATLEETPDTEHTKNLINGHAKNAGRHNRATSLLTTEGFEHALQANLETDYTFDRFVVGKPNEFAYAAAQRVANTPDGAYNPLYLYGGVGLGKTHLMHAVGNAAREHNPSCRVLYLSAEDFTNNFISALREKETFKFKNLIRSVDVLLLDDIQFIARKGTTQEEFFYTFNSLVNDGRQVVISSDRPPAELDGLEERIRSRLGWGLTADIHPTDYELRLGILRSKAEATMAKEGGLEIPSNILEFLAHKVRSNVRVLEGALTRVHVHMGFVGRAIDLEETRNLLHDLLRSTDRQITIEEIQRKVAEHFNIRISDLVSARRGKNVARPRQVAMFLCKLLTTRSFPEIGRKFGGRDHTTVMYAVRRIEELRQDDPELDQAVELLTRILEQ